MNRLALICLGTIFALSHASVVRAFPGERRQDPIHERVQHHYADSNGVKIHYVSLGKGPLVVMIHGFPDYWYTWRHQMEALSKEYEVIALDMRGYNRSDKPKNVANYDLKLLVEDVAAVIRDAGGKRATIAGHDWGGAVAWYFAMGKPEMTERLIILNLPHFRGIQRELANNPRQHKNSQYARNFQKDGAHKFLSAKLLAGWVKDPEAKKRYIEAFNRSDFEAMLNYYKQNYPRKPYKKDMYPFVKVKVPVLMFHGLKDWALLPGALNDTWEWLEKDLPLVTVPDAGHFVQQDAADTVTRTMKMWLALQTGK
jgi:pimeloyl-ACP methyl ester carboxylesterase